MDGEFCPPIAPASASPPSDPTTPATDGKPVCLPFRCDSFSFLGPILAVLNPREHINLAITPQHLRVELGTPDMPVEVTIGYAVDHCKRLHRPPPSPGVFDPNQDVFDYEPPGGYCILDDFAVDGPRPEHALLALPATALRFAAHASNHPPPNAKRGRVPDRSVGCPRDPESHHRQLWTISADRARGCIELPMPGGDGEHRFSFAAYNPLFLQVPTTSGDAVKIDPSALKEGLRAVAPFASDDRPERALPMPIEVRDGVVLASNGKVFARFTHKGLAGCRFRIAHKDVSKLMRLLPNFSDTQTVGYREDKFVVIADGHLRVAFRPSVRPTQFRDWDALTPDYIFDIDRAYIKKFVHNSQMLAANSGAAQDLQIDLALGFQRKHKVLKASVKRKNQEIKKSGIEIYIFRRDLDSLLSHFSEAVSDCENNPTKATDVAAE